MYLFDYRPWVVGLFMDIVDIVVRDRFVGVIEKSQRDI